MWSIFQTYFDKFHKALPVGDCARFAQAIVGQVDAHEARAPHQQRHERAELRVRERASREHDRLDCRQLSGGVIGEEVR